jgi:hypothetical protein
MKELSGQLASESLQREEIEKLPHEYPDLQNAIDEQLRQELMATEADTYAEFVQAGRLNKELAPYTVSEFRRLVRCLVGVINTHWSTIGLLDAKLQIPAIEKLVHQTAKNPFPKYQFLVIFSFQTNGVKITAEIE